MSWLLFIATLGSLTTVAAPVFLDVLVDNRFFEPPKSFPEFKARLSRPAILDLVVYDDKQRAIYHKASETSLAVHQVQASEIPLTGSQNLSFYLVATDSDGKRAGLYPENPAGGDVIEVKQSGLDSDRHVIWYDLPKAASVRLRAGFQDGPYLAPIVSSTPQPAGHHEIAWDGTCQGGLFTNLYLHPSVHVNVLALSLPVNALATASPLSSSHLPASPVMLPSRIADLASPPAPAKNGRSARSIHDDYDLNLEVAPPQSGVAEIRVDCAPSIRAALLNRRFELMVFLDATFLMEDEHSLLPFSYRVNTRGLAPGRHTITVNTIDSDGTVGTQTRELLVPASGDKL